MLQTGCPRTKIEHSHDKPSEITAILSFSWWRSRRWQTDNNCFVQLKMVFMLSLNLVKFLAPPDSHSLFPLIRNVWNPWVRFTPYEGRNSSCKRNNVMWHEQHPTKPLHLIALPVFLHCLLRAFTLQKLNAITVKLLLVVWYY